MAALANVMTCLVCDDVRFERDGKHILIGIYTGGITVHGSGFITVQPYFIIELEGEGDSQFDIEIELLNISEEPLKKFSFSGQMKHKRDACDIAQVPGPILDFDIEDSGILVVRTKTESKWRDLVRKAVTLIPEEDTESSRNSVSL